MRPPPARARPSRLETVRADGDLKDRARACRASSDLLTVLLADLFGGLPRGTIERLESGRTQNPTVETVLALARLYGTTVDWLISGKGPAPTRAEVRAAIAEAGKRLALRVAGNEDAA